MQDENKRRNELMKKWLDVRKNDQEDDELADEERAQLKETMSKWTQTSGIFESYQKIKETTSKMWETNEKISLLYKQLSGNDFFEKYSFIDRSLFDAFYASSFKQTNNYSSFMKIYEENHAILKGWEQYAVPHIDLYHNIFEALDGLDNEKVKEELDESESLHSTDENVDEVHIKNHYFFDVSQKIYIYTVVTDNAIAESDEISDEQKTLWKKYWKPFLSIVSAVFLNWAMGNTPPQDMQIVQAFEKVAALVESYQFPLETTEVEINDLETIELKTKWGKE